MKMICINCPKGCELDVERVQGIKGSRDQGEDEIIVTGNACPCGEEYGRTELVNPTRMVTGLVRIAGMRKPLSVKTRTAVPKGKINAVLFALHQAIVQLPVKIGDVIIPNVADTGVDVVATAKM